MLAWFTTFAISFVSIEKSLEELASLDGDSEEEEEEEEEEENDDDDDDDEEDEEEDEDFNGVYVVGKNEGVSLSSLSTIVKSG